VTELNPDKTIMVFTDVKQTIKLYAITHVTILLFSFNEMRKFLMFLKYLFPSNVDQLCILEIKPQKSFRIFFL